MATPSLVIRISADVSGANAGLNQTTSQINALNHMANLATGGLSQFNNSINSIARSLEVVNASVPRVIRNLTEMRNATGNASTGLVQLHESATRAGNSINTLKSFLGAFGISIGAVGAALLVKNIVQTNMEMERLRTQLIGVTGSAAVAEQAFKDILKIAKDTPQSVQEISKAFIMLKNFGIQPTMQVMEDLTNMTSKLGGHSDTLTGITLALGQAWGKAKLQAQDTNQMIERGVPVWDMLQQVTGKSTIEIQKMMEAGELTRPVIEKLIHAMGENSIGASKNAMSTLSGQVNILGDSWHHFEDVLMQDKSEGLIKNIVKGITSALDSAASAIDNTLRKKINDAQKNINFYARNPFISGVMNYDKNVDLAIIDTAQKKITLGEMEKKQAEETAQRNKQAQFQADENAKKEALRVERIKEYGTKQQQEIQATKEAKEKYGELSAAELAQIHTKIFGNEIRKHATATHKAESAAMRDAKHAANEYNQLLEKFNGKDPFKEYVKSMSELNRVQKDLAPETVLLNQQKIAAEFEKSTVDLNKYNQEKEKLKNLLSAIETPAQKFTNAIAPYTTAFQDGKLSLEQYTQALAHFQDQLNKPVDKLQHKYDEETRKGYENEIEALRKTQRELTLTSDEMFKFDLAIRKTSDGLQALYSEEQINGIMKLHDEVSKLKFIDDIGLSMRAISSSFSTMFSNVLTKGMSFTTALRDMFKNTMSKIKDGLMNFGMTSMMNGNFLAGAASMAGSVVMGLLQSVFKGKTIDLTAPESSTTGSVLGDYEASSNSFKNIVSTLNSIHADEYAELKGINSNFKNLVEQTTKGTAMALRDRGAFSFSNTPMKNSNTGASVNPAGSPGMIGAGLVAGSALGAATSGGLAGAALASATGMASATAVSGSIGMAAGGGIGAGAVAIGGAIIGLAGGLILTGLVMGLGKLLGIGKVKFEAVGGGIVSNAQQFVLDGMQQVVIMDYSRIKKTVKGWFSDDVTYFDVINGKDKPLTKLFSGVFNQVGTRIVQSASILGMSDLINRDIGLPKMKLALKAGDKNQADNQKKIEDYLNKTSDNLADSALGQFFAQYQQMGEGMLETTQRLTNQAVIAKAGFEKLGVTVKLSGLGLVSFSDSMATAFGGLKEFQAGLDDLYNTFTSDDKKLADGKIVAQKLADSTQSPLLGDLPKSIQTDADVVKFTTALGDTAVALSNIIGQYKGATNQKPDYDNGILSVAKKLAGNDSITQDGKKLLLNSGASIDTETLKKSLEGSKFSLYGDAKTQAIKYDDYKKLMDYAKSNTNYADSQNAFGSAQNNSNKDWSLLSKIGVALPSTFDEVPKFVESLESLNSVIAENIKSFRDNSKTLKLVTAEQQKSATAMINFKKSVSDWVISKQINQLGTPESQLDAARKSYESQLSILKNSASSELDKTNAMSKITGAADSYISKIEQLYAHGDIGSNLINGIVNEVGALPDVLSVSELQLNALNSIDSGIKQLVNGYASFEADAINAGYSGDYTDIPAMQAFMTKAASNDSSTKTDETIVELKKQNDSLTEMVVELKALVSTTVAANQEITAQLNDLNNNAKTTANSTKLQVLK